MRPLEIEAWARDVIEQVQLNGPSEDSLVELKSGWIDPKKAARVLAAQANAVGGEIILWLIGIDEKTGEIKGADKTELANWWASVQACFDEAAPELIRTLNLTIENKPAFVALAFNTDLAPYVSKIENGGVVDRGILWRDGNRTRAARRSEVLKLFLQTVRTPTVEFISAEMGLSHRPEFGEIRLNWQLKMDLYVIPNDANQLVIPFHKSSAFFNFSEPNDVLKLDNLRIGPPYIWFPGQGTVEIRSQTVSKTDDEVFILGPGKIRIEANLSETRETLNFEGDISVFVILNPIGTNHPIEITRTLILTDEQTQVQQNIWKLESK